MRIIAGKLKGRQLVAPKGHRTHPMSEKMRGGLFSALGDIEGLSMLDAFGGSGALAFEGISRGASHATVVEIDKSNHRHIGESNQLLNTNSEIKAIRANVSAWSDNNPEQKFDLVLCDPPYDTLQISVLQKLVRHVAENGLFVLSWPGKLEIPAFVGLKQIKNKNYGDSQLAFFKRI